MSSKSRMVVLLDHLLILLVTKAGGFPISKFGYFSKLRAPIG